MAEYIEREAVLELVEPDARPFLAERIKSIPAADVREVVVGKWIKTVGENGVTSACRCSECGFEDNRYSLFSFCPNCGADMREEQDGR